MALFVVAFWKLFEFNLQLKRAGSGVRCRLFFIDFSGKRVSCYDRYFQAERISRKGESALRPL